MQKIELSNMLTSRVAICKGWLRLCLLCVLAVVWASARAEDIQVYDLVYRTGEEITPLLQQAFSGEDIVITANQKKLVVRANNENQLRVVELLKKLDVPGKNLLIHLHQGSLQSGRVYSTAARDDQNKDQQIHVLEGEKASFWLKQQQPQLTGAHTSVDQNNHASSGVSMTWILQKDGYDIQANLLGSTRALVRINKKDILPQNDNSVLQVQKMTELQTVTEVQLGQWTLVSGLGGSQKNSNETVYVTDRHNNQQLWIKIEVVP